MKMTEYIILKKGSVLCHKSLDKTLEFHKTDPFYCFLDNYSNNHNNNNCKIIFKIKTKRDLKLFIAMTDVEMDEEKRVLWKTNTSCILFIDNDNFTQKDDTKRKKIVGIINQLEGNIFDGFISLYYNGGEIEICIFKDVADNLSICNENFKQEYERGFKEEQ